MKNQEIITAIEEFKKLLVGLANSYKRVIEVRWSQSEEHNFGEVDLQILWTPQNSVPVIAYDLKAQMDLSISFGLSIQEIVLPLGLNFVRKDSGYLFYNNLEATKTLAFHLSGFYYPTE